MMLETNKNYFSDNREILKSIPDKSINLFLEDMPYNTTQCDWEYEVDLEEYWRLRLPKLADKGVFVLTGVEPFSSKLRLSNEKMYKIDWAWEKESAGNFMNVGKHPFKMFENVLIFSRGDHTYNPIRIPRNDASLKRVKAGVVYTRKPCKNSEGVVHYNVKNSGSSTAADGLKNPSNIVFFTKYDMYNKYAGIRHPTRKPIELFSYFIKTYTNENDIVFDGYSGSGTTAIACIRNNRKYIICENKKEYFDLQTKRIQEEIDKTSLFNSLGGRQDRISA